MKTLKNVKPPLDGPFYTLEAKNIETQRMQWVVATDAQAVCAGNFSVLATCGTKKYADFVAVACNALSKER